jgi:F0F1-type ATP synthase membrane subunit c/vacuolar-type H+-ATPase subunit K
VETALVAAIAMRLGTLWYAIAIGLTAAAALEIRQTVTRAVRK